MSQLAVLTACQMPEKSGLPAAVRGIVFACTGPPRPAPCAKTGRAAHVMPKTTTDRKVAARMGEMLIHRCRERRHIQRVRLAIGGSCPALLTELDCYSSSSADLKFELLIIERSAATKSGGS